MNNENKKYKNSVRTICEELGCSELEEERISEYLEGNKVSLNDFLYRDFFQLAVNVKNNVRELYLDIDDDNYRKRIFNVLFAIGKQSVFNIIRPYEI